MSLASQVNLFAARVGQECKTIKSLANATAADLTSYKGTVTQAIADAKTEVKSEILNGASSAYDTLKEIEDLMKTNDDIVSALNSAKFVKYDAQTLTTAEQTQARTNIGAAAAADLTTLDGNAIKKTSQTLTGEEKAQARTNIGAANEAEVVKFVSQTLTAEQQSQARANIGVASSADAVLVTAQTLQTSQQAQARANIDAASATDMGDATTNFVSTFETALLAADESE